MKFFNSAEFSQIKNESPKKSFVITTSSWCSRTNAIGITSSRGKYSVGTFAHSNIALEFASWVDNLFKPYLKNELIKYYPSLKDTKVFDSLK